MNKDDTFIIETRLSGCLIEPYGALECDFNAEFPTWIVAYCPDTDSWFCTNQRFFYYEHPIEFTSEGDATEYFKSHISEFVELNNEMHPGTTDKVFLENTGEMYMRGVENAIKQ